MAAALAVFLIVQPWLVWPHLTSDVSHRLTLTCSMVGLGLWQIVSAPATILLPRAWALWVFACLAVLVRHAWQIVVSGGYFEFFQETALFSDGLITLLSLTWGLWALLQQPTRAFRVGRWGWMAFLAINLVMAASQWITHQTVTGVLGVDRLLGAYAVMAIPLCLTWRRPLVIVPLALLLLAQKPLPCLAALIACWPLIRARWRGLYTIALTSAALWFVCTSSTLKITQRADTWWHALQASGAHPWGGWGFDPMVFGTISQQYGYLLPNLHSDWLALAVQAGWLVALGAFSLWGRIVLTIPRTSWARACQGSLLGLGVLCAVQSTISHARLGGVALFLLAWFTAEQRQEHVHA